MQKNQLCKCVPEPWRLTGISFSWPPRIPLHSPVPESLSASVYLVRDAKPCPCLLCGLKFTPVHSRPEAHILYRSLSTVICLWREMEEEEEEEGEEEENTPPGCYCCSLKRSLRYPDKMNWTCTYSAGSSLKRTTPLFPETFFLPYLELVCWKESGMGEWYTKPQ